MDSRPQTPALTFFDQLLTLLVDAAAQLSPDSALSRQLREAHSAAANVSPIVLLSGLRSVGKSSLVCSLWGDSELLPTAERDCTQTNTLIRPPGESEDDRHIRLAYLTRDAATGYAARGLAFHHLAELVSETLGPLGPRLDEGSAEERLRKAVSLVKKIFAEKPKLAVLHENFTDDLREIEQLLAFLDSEQFREGQRVEAKWSGRREHLMGLRHPDGRTLDVGPLLALQHVELVRESSRWGRLIPRLIDTPYVPAFHNARRADLILDQACRADILLIVARPELFTPEDWVQAFFKERPELAARTLVVFNQIDTVDLTQLFGRDGFAFAFEKNLQRLNELRIKPQNIFVSCARLPFLVNAQQSAAENAASIGERIAKLRGVLERIRKQTESKPASVLKERLLQACDENDCGIESLRARIHALSLELLLKRGAADALSAIRKSPELSTDVALQARTAELLDKMPGPKSLF
ncbi:MAG TPA: hypothetical protein VEK08_01080 [Planctomycetota bacterium]|nr:hypothetical protein [Planctomycetota bacterium]